MSCQARLPGGAVRVIAAPGLAFGAGGICSTARLAVDFLPQIFPYLRGLFAGALPDVPGDPLSSFTLPITGSGTYEDPWVLPITTTSRTGIDAP